MAAVDKIRQVSNSENRVCSRFKCEVATYCFSSEERWTCKIVDLSERGLGIVSASMLNEGTMVNFTDPETRAKVIWVEENRAGLRIIH
jgi:hypothetical protein